MRFQKWRSLGAVILVPVLSLTLLTLSGCDSSTDSATTEVSPAADEHDHATEIVDDHSGWWCAPHGVPEEECALCKTSLIAEFKADGDWCEEHNRPDSQCFSCHPENFEKFAARYEAKYGEQPPKPTR